jgi:hypothetical protein
MTRSGDRPEVLSGDRPEDLPGDRPGDRSGDLSGDRPEDLPGDRPGDLSGDRPEDLSGPEHLSGDRPGDRPGDLSGDRPEDLPRDRPGDLSGDRPDLSGPEHLSGDTPEDLPGDRSGDLPEGRPGERIEQLITELVRAAPACDPAVAGELVARLRGVASPLARSIADAVEGVTGGRIDAGIALPPLAMACATLAAGERGELGERELEAARYEIDTLLPLPHGRPVLAAPDVPVSALRKRTGPG